MVMATGGVCLPYGTGDPPQEAAEGAEARDSAAALHERLVAFVNALAPQYEGHTGVWVEHSYARPSGAVHGPSSHVRVLLAPPIEPPDLPGDEIDVEKEDPPSPSPPEPKRSTRSQRSHSPSDTEDEGTEEEWEPRVTALAPSAAHAALAELAIDTLRRLRLARLASGRSAAREHERLAARRLRHALVAAASAPGPQAQRPGPWLHATLLAYMPRSVRRLYDILTSELRRAAPRLAERMMGVRAPPPRREPLAGVGPPIGPEANLWLVWLGSGSEKQDRRWRRRLSALLHTRVLPAPAVGVLKPDAWCAAVASSMRGALADTLTEAGDRAVILGGAGMGATLCIALANAVAGTATNTATAAASNTGSNTTSNTSGVRGLLLLSPPLLTAEGPRDTPDDPLAEIRLPMLLVSGTGASASWRGAARALCRSKDGARRLLEVHGADDALRASAQIRRRRKLPQHALDAAIADECARWAQETVDKATAPSPPLTPPRPPTTKLRRDQRATNTHTTVVTTVVSADDEDEYAHLPSATSTARLERPIEVTNSPHPVTVCDGRLVSRGSGSTPLALLPPRRTPTTPAPPLAPADIMRLPIVFADDEGVPTTHYDDVTPDTPVTVTSGDSVASPVTWRGSGNYTRVIVASRGGNRPAGVNARGATRGGARPLLLRRTVRMVRESPRN